MLSERGPLGSLFIQKTGGTTAKEVLRSNFGELFLLYLRNNNTFIYPSDRLLPRDDPRVDRVLSFVREHPTLSFINQAQRKIQGRSEKRHSFDASELPNHDFAAVHGQFDMATVRDMLPSDTRFVTVLRDPLQRTVSEFKYWHVSQGRAHARHGIAYDPDMRFTDYALHKSLRNFQSKALGGWDISDFHLVGITERLDAYFEELGLHTGPNSPHLNQSPPRLDEIDLGITDDFMRRFQEANELDYELYERARQQWST